MFRRKSQDTESNNTNNMTQENPKPKYPKPHILLMDLDKDVGTHLKNCGFDIAEGSFGTPYKVLRGNLHYAKRNDSIPANFREREIIIVDISASTLPNESDGNEMIARDGTHYSLVTPIGIFDPRPMIMNSLANDFDQIQKHGGIFIIFAAPKTLATGQDALLGNYDDPNTWSFLSQLDYANVYELEGTETKPIFDNIDLFNKYLTNVPYKCKISFSNNNSWLPIAINKYEEIVSGAITPKTKNNGLGGFIFIFPQIQNKATFLERFLTEYLPDVSPELFPHIEGRNWLHQPEYELPAITTLSNKIEKVRKEKDAQIAALERKIEEKRDANQYIYDLVSATGDTLEVAVQQALHTLGFTDVVNMDEELEKNGDDGTKREDLQIRDGSPLVLVEIKGITGLPKDTNSIQVTKYFFQRGKSLKRFDIRGLSIVNHKRNIPLKEREYNPFSEDVLGTASNGDFGLLTGWGLYKLVRSFTKLGWKHEYVRELFYDDGFIEPIPKHYEYVGIIEEYWKKPNVIGVRIEKGEIQQGDIIAYDLSIEFEEQVVGSLQVENTPVEIANIGDLAGILVDIDTEKIKKKTKIYRVKRN